MAKASLGDCQWNDSGGVRMVIHRDLGDIRGCLEVGVSIGIAHHASVVCTWITVKPQGDPMFVSEAHYLFGLV